MLNYSFDRKPNRPVIVFLHGFLGCGEDFAEVVAIAKDHFSILTLDLPGHGKTKLTTDYTMPKTAVAIAALLDTLKIPKAFLVGYSMGGRLALYLAIHFPERFPKVILESGSPGLKTEEERSQRLQRDFALADQLETNFSQFLEEWYEQPLFQSIRQHPRFEEMMEQRSQNDPVELARSLREMSTGMQPSLWEKLAAHRNPLLLVVGECDHKFIEINQAVKSMCETAELVVVSGVGHNVHFEKPEAIATQILNFF